MGEIKSVKVDNWGVFFLQKLQNFFNKTDYCDLTLQFRDNSQLKVHRLVLSACTDYFNVLEQTCEVIDDALIMPNELQADVVVPIVNFMYTGTLEFELKMYGKLLRTAKEMNMTVLLKLLEAHRRTMENVNRQQRPPSPKAIRRRVPVAGQTNAMPIHQTQMTQGRRVLAPNVVVAGGGGHQNVVQRRPIVQTKTAGTNVSPVQIQYRQQIGSTSVVRTSTLRAGQQQQPIHQQQQQNVQSYIKNEPSEYETYEAAGGGGGGGGGQMHASSSPFEQLRKGYNNNKRPAVSTFLSPPAKKPNLEDVKEFAEQQRMRKQIAAEYGEDAEFDSMMDDDGMIHNDDDDEDGIATANSTFNSGNAAQAATTSSQVATATITIKPESDSQPPTIIVKDHSGSKMDHAKIISEVLRQYPQLAKGNKNIKLKIMPTGQGQAQRIVIKNEANNAESQSQPQQQRQQQTQLQQQQLRTVATTHVITKSGEKVPQKQFQHQATAQAAASLVKTTTAAVASTQATQQTTAVAATTTDNAQQKRRIDSKTMHALIALGAENMTGPWLCLRCGLNGRPISIPSYRGFRRHLINTHKERIDPALCEHCGWRSQNNRELHFHVQIEHKIKTTLYTFPECLLCAELFLDTNALNQHMLDSHPSANKQQCIYCNKIFMKDTQLYTHLKLYHKHQAIEDGIIDVSEEEYGGCGGGGGGLEMHDNEMEEHLDSVSSSSEQLPEKGKKVKILSDISLPMSSSIVKLSGNTLAAESKVIDSQTKFVTSDGNEMILTDEQRQEIISQLNQDPNNGDGAGGGVVMVLNDAIFTNESVNSTESATATATANPQAAENIETDELDDSQIYAELASDKAEKEKQAADAQEADESLKWAENLISEHDMADNEHESGTAKTHEEDKAKKELISKKLKELTVDWSEDENEDNEEALDSAETETEPEQTKGESVSNKEKTEMNEKTAAKADKQLEEDVEIAESSSEQKSGVEEPQINEGEEQLETAAKVAEKDLMEQDLNEHDALELAMHNLHEDGSTMDEMETTPATIETTDEVAKKKESENDGATATVGVEDDVDDEHKELMAAHADNSSLNSTLLDELMSTESTTAADVEPTIKLEDETVKSETKASTSNAAADDDLDAFAKAGLNDVEEFSTIDTIAAAKSSSNIDEVKVEAEQSEAAEKSKEQTTEAETEAATAAKEVTTAETPTSKTTTTATAEKANLGSDWEELDYDDSKLH